MSLFDELLVYLVSGNRLEFLKFRHKVIRQYGQEKFTKLLNKANKELKNEIRLQ